MVSANTIRSAMALLANWTGPRWSSFFNLVCINSLDIMATIAPALQYNAKCVWYHIQYNLHALNKTSFFKWCVRCFMLQLAIICSLKWDNTYIDVIRDLAFPLHKPITVICTCLSGTWHCKVKSVWFKFRQISFFTCTTSLVNIGSEMNFHFIRYLWNELCVLYPRASGEGI